MYTGFQWSENPQLTERLKFKNKESNKKNNHPRITIDYTVPSILCNRTPYELNSKGHPDKH